MRTSFLFLFSSIMLCLACAIATAQSSASPPSALPTTMATTVPTSAPAEITWDQAKDHIGQSVIVTGPVVGTHDLGGAVVLNVGKDFPDKTRFTVYISADDRKAMPADLDQDKTVAVTGTLKLYHRVPEIEADAAHIIVVGPNATTAASTQP